MPQNKIHYFNGDAYIEKGYRSYWFTGPKNIGKTYWGFNRGIRDYEDYKEGFGWVFNTQIEAKEFCKKEVYSYLDPKKYKLQGQMIYDKKDGQIVAVIGSYASPHLFKNVQTIRTLYIDELENGTGLVDKEIGFQRLVILMSNIERSKDGYKQFMFMNAYTKNNIIHVGMGLDWDGKGTKYFPDYELKCVALEPSLFITQAYKNKSLAYKWSLANKQINEMAFENKFSFDDDRMIDWDKRNIIKRPLYQLNYMDQKFSVYENIDGKIYFDYDRDLPLVKELSLSVLDFIRNQDNRKKDSDRQYDLIFKKWEYAIINNEVLFKDYNLRDTITRFLAIRKAAN